jgi:hypothetical protein
MKSCPVCHRTFEDTFTFCLADGSLLSPPFDPQATQRLPASRNSAPPPTEVLTNAAAPNILPPTQPAREMQDAPPTIASPTPFPVVQHEQAQRFPIGQRTPFYIYLFAMFAGFAVELVFRYAGFGFFFRSPFYVLFGAILLTYGSLGVFFGYVWPQKGWKWGIWIVALAWLFEAFFTLPYLKIIMELGMLWIPYAHLIWAPITAGVGASLGARLSLKRNSP